MSRQLDYLAKAAEVASLAERVEDPATRRSLLQAAESWRLLAETDDDDPVSGRLGVARPALTAPRVSPGR